jgi:hypothetical protein
MQNLWSVLWDHDKLIKKKLKIITKPILKKNKFRVIISYKAESPTNQMSKDEIKKINYTKDFKK